MQRKHQIIMQTSPVKSPSPDRRNHHRILNTCIQANTIKRYLQSIKNIDQHETPQSQTHSIQQSPHRYAYNKVQASPQSRNQEMLRRRIMELEMQNNQFRLISQEFEDLSNKNRQLQQKMLMLLSELEYSSSQPRTHTKSLSYNYKTQKMDGFSTIENIRTEQSKQQTTKQIYPINQFEEQLKNSPFDHLRIQTHKKNHKESAEKQQHLRRLIDTQISTSLENFQSVFIKLVKLLDSQLNQLKANTQQMQNLPLILSSSSESNNEVSKVQYQNLLYKINKPNHQCSLDSNKKNQYKIKKQLEVSKVEIQVQNITGSQRSFGNMHRSHLLAQRRSPQLYEKQQKRDTHVRQSLTYQPNYTDQIIKRVLQSIDTINTHLAIILSEQSRIKQTTTFEFQNQIFQKLMDIISTHFPHKKMHTSSLICEQNLRESLLLRQKIKITESGELYQAHHKEQREVQSQLPNIEEQRMSNLQLASNKCDVPSQEFEQTKRKLLQIIQIMKSINQDYRRTLSQKLIGRHKVEPIATSHRFF